MISAQIIILQEGLENKLKVIGGPEKSEGDDPITVIGLPGTHSPVVVPWPDAGKVGVNMAPYRAR